MAKNIESIDQEIDIINRIILHGILHGSDPCCTYDSNEEKLISTINDWIKYKCLENEYCVSKINIEFKEYGCMYDLGEEPQIINKNNPVTKKYYEI